MTEEERINRFLDAQENPEKYPDAELETILDDGKELAELKRAQCFAHPTTADDARKAWREFNRKHLANRHKPIFRAAAVFISLLIVGSIAMAAVVGLHLINSNKAEQKQSVAPQKTEMAVAKAVSAVPKDTLKQRPKPQTAIKEFDNVRLESILAAMGEYYKVSVEYADNDVKGIRLYFEWNQTLSLDDVISQLNGFQKINITRQGTRLTVR